MLLREHNNPFEQAKKKFDKAISAQPVGRAALLSALYGLEEAGVAQQSAGSLDMSDLATTMRDVMAPIETADYTKPPLNAEQLGEIIGKHSVYAMIAEAQATEPTAMADEPTDTKKIDTAKRKG